MQIHSSSKIPVIEYPTKLENIIQLCFYTTIICAFESGIIYNLILNRFNILNKTFTEQTFKKMETLGIYKNILVYKTDDKNIDNIHFPTYKKNVILFDNIFRVLLFISYFTLIILLLI